ncbi:RagB/SusD family nutrient uptake outer membrane protein [Mucilaginibacter sp. PAMB04168]|uniref:RagB/SusD family nutrient uptake outer membrane protein n=1 Tax=Mucilaginibacter sp. PAMB04168 TaxID=3138567 RepID=UPI0031F68A6D
MTYSTKYLKALFIAGLITTTVGCKKNIDLLPSDNITSANAYLTSANIESGIVGAYAALSYDNSILVNSVLTDEVRSALDNGPRNFYSEQRWQFDGTSGNATAAWFNLYLVIDRVNRVLEAIDNVPGDKVTIDRQKGELYALRGFCHFELLRNYAANYDATALGVPVITKSDVLGQPKRNTFAEVVAAVKTDLTAAKGLIPTTFTDNTRMTRLAVSATQARVALYEKNWDDAITYSSEVIAASPLATRTQFPSIWTDASQAEVVFTIKRTSNTSYIGLLYRDTNNDVFYSPSFKLIDLFDKTNDVRYNAYIKQDLTLPATREQWLVNKYAGSGTSNKFNNTKVFRTGEMYLIRAEAYEQKNNLTSSASDLNTLRAARITGYTNIAFASQADAESTILTERFKELFAEGHRYFDLKRKNLPIVRDNRDLTEPTIPKTLNPTDRNYRLPIPQPEVFANPNILPNNPGY